MGRPRKQHTGEVIESFFGVYLLESSCILPRFKGRTYIGFTVDPNRRIQQHNLGKDKGGARRTHNRGPWDMVMIIHGFPNEISALRFEWAWQNPQRSRRLRHVPKKKNKERHFDFAMRILSEMLCVGPWSRLPLVIRWLIPEREIQFPPERRAPFHMSIAYGPVVSKKLPPPSNNRNEEDPLDVETVCALCTRACTSHQLMTCIKPGCNLQAHAVCLASNFLKKETDHIIPVEGTCPECYTSVLWGDLVRKKKGCYTNLVMEEEFGNSSDCDLNI